MASKRGIRRRRCVGKKRYATARQAEYDAAALSRQHREQLEAYRCPHCVGIHVGHVPRLLPPAPAAGWGKP